MNHIARYIPLDLSDYEGLPTDAEEHDLSVIRQMEIALREFRTKLAGIPIANGRHVPDTRDWFEMIGQWAGELDQAQSTIFNEINERDDAYEIAQLRNDERRGDYE